MERYYTKYAAAVVRGALIRQGRQELLPKELMTAPLDSMQTEELDRIIDLGISLDMKIYHFKRSDRTLPRVHKVLGFLKGVYFDSLLDVGSGRGVFLLPFLEEFPYINVTSMDLLDKRVQMLENIRRGGVDRLTVCGESICDTSLPDKSYSVVTMLEVLEHIPDVEQAIRQAVRLARDYVVVTVPSKEDDNPEHIHLLTKEKLTRYFNDAGVSRLSFDGVPGHLFMIGRL